jgi:hypothetical protein
MLLLAVLFISAALSAHTPQGDVRSAIVSAAKAPITKNLNGLGVVFKFGVLLRSGNFVFYQGSLLKKSTGKVESKKSTSFT